MLEKYFHYFGAASARGHNQWFIGSKAWICPMNEEQVNERQVIPNHSKNQRRPSGWIRAIETIYRTSLGQKVFYHRNV
jgi:hypothetical protein